LLLVYNRFKYEKKERMVFINHARKNENMVCQNNFGLKKTYKVINA
jgi:hypothetical protein